MIRRLAVLVILLGLVTTPVAAQPTAEPILAMLQNVPEEALRGRTILSYVDYRAVEAARAGAARPESFADWAALQAAGAIVAAQGNRGFSSVQTRAWTLVCGAAGCEEGQAINLAAREPADPFGGQLGRQQPLLVSDDTLLGSAALDTLEAMRDVADGTAGSLVNSTAVRSALGVVPDGVLLRQATSSRPRHSSLPMCPRE